MPGTFLASQKASSEWRRVKHEQNSTRFQNQHRQPPLLCVLILVPRSPFRVPHPFPCKDAIMNATAALWPTVADFLDSLKESLGAGSRARQLYSRRLRL